MRYHELEERMPEVPVEVIKDWTGEITRAVGRLRSVLGPKVAELNHKFDSGQHDGEAFLRWALKYAVGHDYDELLDPNDPAGQKYIREARRMALELQLNGKLVAAAFDSSKG